MTMVRLVRIFSFVTFAAVVSSCGGGGGGSASPPPPPAGSGWQSGVFADFDNYFARCESPRPGNNPQTGRPWPDVQGSTLDENNFLRSYTNDTYLWYDEVVDRDPGLYNDPRSYFDVLKTFETLPSGRPKDPANFHFWYDTNEWLNLQAGVTFGYGAEIAVVAALPPREVVVVFTEPNSPATNANIARGARVVGVDGFDIDDPTQAGTNAINAALFPDTNGEMHTFSILDLGAQNPRSVTLTATTINETFVKNVGVLDTPSGSVGYMLFTAHRPPAEEELIDAVNQFNAHNGGQGIDDLVLDLRYNGGGLLYMGAQLGYMIAGAAATNGRDFEATRFNDKHPTIDPVTGLPIETVPFVNETIGYDNLPPGQPLPTLNLQRVFVLTGSNTCSASESVMNALRGVDVQVIQIGGTTCGKPYGFYPTDNCGTTFFTVQFRGVNDKNYGDYVEGFQPAAVDDGQARVLGCPVADDYSQALGDPNEDRFEVALAYQAGMGCVTPSATGGGTLSKPVFDPGTSDGYLKKTPYDTNRIYYRP